MVQRINKPPLSLLILVATSLILMPLTVALGLERANDKDKHLSMLMEVPEGKKITKFYHQGHTCFLLEEDSGKFLDLECF